VHQVKLRSQRTVVTRCHGLASELRAALARLPSNQGDPEVIDAIWRGEALGTLLWALTLVELPAYDTPFDYDALVAERIDNPRLRSEDEIEHARDAARLWHWRARTTMLEAEGSVALPERWQSFDQLIAATAMHGFESGLLPAPLRGDFRAFDTVYRRLTSTQHAVTHSIALERHHALNWLCGLGSTWEDVPTDT
jgi:Domain of unknown function (DUF4272)